MQWLNRLGRIVARRERPPAAVVAVKTGPARSGLDLANVRVVRNDLSQADLEFVAIPRIRLVNVGPEASKPPVVRPGRSGWARMVSRLFDWGRAWR
jgi:hypothetical protein